MANTTVHVVQSSAKNISNVSSISNSSGYRELSGIIFPKSPMPAWVPATSVAIVMLVFLTISFHIRHRKVLKKRQILMDYFYIIFQYGGVRRKRMVTALCNTNAIRLSHLGRSFMISFDNNNDNSCPFFTDETAFTKTSSYTSHSQSNGASKTKSRLKAPFRRMLTQVEDGHLGSSVNEMLMKFKKKKKTPGVSPGNRQGLAPPRRSSMSSIHGDDPYVYSDRSEYETTPRFNQRRNAYVIRNSETDTSGTMEMCSDMDESELTNLFIERNKLRRKSSVRRKSQIYHCVDTDEDGLHFLGQSSQNLRVLQLGNSTSSRKLSQGSFHQNSRQYSSKNEPLILIQTASTDVSSSQESDDIPAHCPKGVVVLRRVSRDNSKGDQYYIDEQSVAYNQSKRNSLSTVSYVQSSNVNDYYGHCLHSPKRPEDEFDEDQFCFEENKHSSKPKIGRGWRKSGASKKYSPQKTAYPPQRKRTRLSLGDIGVGNFNFNRRIEESMGSMQEQDSEGSFSGKLSKELSDEKSEKAKSSSTWRRLKNVFAGIRWSQTSGPKMKQSKSPVSEDRIKVRNKRNNTGNGKLNRFLSALTGFRSLPEDKKYSSISTGGPKGSKSLPMGLDRHSFTVDDFEFHLAMTMDPKPKKRIFRHSVSKTDVLNDKSNRKVPPKTRSFPDNIFLFQGGDPKPKPTPCLYHLQSDPSGTASYRIGRKHKRRSERSEDHSKCRSSSNIDFIHSPVHLSSFSDSNNKLCYFRSGSMSPRSTSPMTRKRDRRYRSLSPLPEWHNFQSSPRKGKPTKKWYSHSARNSFSERGVPMSPSVRFNIGDDDNDFQFPESITKGMSHDNVNVNATPTRSRVKSSCDDLLTAPLLTVQTEQSCREKVLPTPTVVDFVTIDMEPCSTDQETNATTTCVVLENTRGDNNSKDECCSVESDPVTANSEFISIESPSKSSQPSHERTNSSMDSVYWDTFSIPDSPLTALRANAARNAAASINSLSADCDDQCVITMPSHHPTAAPSSPINSHSPISIITHQEASKSLSILTTPERSNLNNASSAAEDEIPLVVEDDTADYACGSGYPAQTNAAFTSNNVPDDVIYKAPVTMDSICIDMDIDHDNSLCDVHNPDCFNNEQHSIPLLPSMRRQPTLEKQESITSEEDMMNLTRLPRFGRRSSQLYGSPLLKGLKQQKDTDSSYK